MSATTTTFSVQEVAQHNSRDDLYMIIKGKVYNCTDFLSRHPGGEDVLEEVAGTDATEAYMDVGHSEEADKLLARYHIGSIIDLKPRTGPGLSAGSSAPAYLKPLTLLGVIMAIIIGLILAMSNGRNK